MIYLQILAIIKWTTGVALVNYSEGVVFSHFSQTYVALGLYVILLGVCLKRDLSIFIKISTYGAIVTGMIALVIVSIGIYAFSNTKFIAVFFPTQEQRELEIGEISTNVREIFMINANFSPLAGVLGIGFFLHPVSISIVRRNEK